MNTPEELLYAATHEWVRFKDETTALVGLTDFAQDKLGDLVFVNLPETGAEATCGETLCDVESVKAVSDVYSPVTGRITAVNEALADSPELINQDPYGAWIAEISDVASREGLLSAGEYETVCAKEE